LKFLAKIIIFQIKAKKSILKAKNSIFAPTKNVGQVAHFRAFFMPATELKNMERSHVFVVMTITSRLRGFVNGSAFLFKSIL